MCVNPGSAFNCYWEMPFRTGARITLTNESEEERYLYYQIDYSECEVPDDAAYFCAQWRRVNPLPKGDVVTILDGVQGRGQFVGLHCCWGVNNSGWWGEGEVKFFIDGDGEFPTICGTGTEDYFCGSYNFDRDGQYTEFVTPYAGMPQVLRPDGTYKSQQRFSLYRWHITDPIRFRTDLQGDDAGARLAARHEVLAAAGRHRHYRVLVSDDAGRRLPATAGPRRPRDHLAKTVCVTMNRG